MSDRLIDRWVSGTASAEDRAELVDLIEADPSLVAKLYRAAERECDLHDFYGTTRVITLHPPRANARNSQRPRTRLTRFPWIPISAAVAALLVIGILLLSVIESRSESVSAPSVAITPTAIPPGTSPNTTTLPVAENPIFPQPAFTKDVPLPIVTARPANKATGKAPELLATKPKPMMAPPSQPLSARATPPIAAAVSGFDRVDGELKDEAGELVMRYSLRAPTTLPNHPQLGLLLAFHGAGGNEKYLADPLLNALAQSGRQPDMVVAALKSSGDNWIANDEANIISFINWALRTYPIDPRRIIIQGTSNGGWLVNYFGSRHPELIAGVVTVCGGNGFEMPAKRPINANENGFEYYVIHGTADESVPVKNARAVIDALRSNGYRYVYREYPGVGHEVFSDKETRADSASWMTRLRHKTMPLSEADRKILAAYNKTDQAEALLLTEAGAQTLIRIGGLPAEKILARALRSKNPDVRARATALFADTSCMPGASALLADGLDDKEANVRIATINTLGRLADWNDQEALISLCRFAGNDSGALDERLIATSVLSNSFAMRCWPNVSNQPTYELLIHLLDDKEERLREAAIAILLSRNSDTFGYLSDLPSQGRRNAVIAWRRWYIELFNPPPTKP